MNVKGMNTCPNCGGMTSKNNGEYVCQYCGQTFREESLIENLSDIIETLGGAINDALVEQRMDDIANARRNLYAATHEDYIDSGKVLQYSKKLKEYLPDDVQANFYETAVGANAKNINKFIDNIDAEKCGYLADDIIEFMLGSLEKCNILTLENFIERVYKNGNSKFVEYRTRVEQESVKLDEGIYNPDIPRDVFLAYSSADWKTVNEICEYLEENGLHCFVALKNLRHGKGAVENYKSNLEKAMHNAKCFVFISTENSCDLSCDALKVEIPYMRDFEPNKGRIEYVPSGKRSKMTDAAKILVNDFFDAEYCTNKEDLLKRIVLKITTKRNISKSATEKFCKACGTQNYLNAKLCCECGNKEFVDTYEEYARLKAEEQVGKEFAEKVERERNEKVALAAKAEQERIARERLKQDADREKAALAAELERMKAELAEKAEQKARAEQSEQERNNELNALKNSLGVVNLNLPKIEINIDEYIRRINDETSNLSDKQRIEQLVKAKKEYYNKVKNGQINVTNNDKNSDEKYDIMYEGFHIVNGVLKEYKGNDVHIVIPQGVVIIGGYAFRRGFRSQIKSVQIPSSVEVIESHAFITCFDLLSVEIKHGLKVIANEAFAGCSNLTDISIPNSVVAIGNNAFERCESLREILIPYSVKVMGDYIFAKCNNKLIINCETMNLSLPTEWNKNWNKKSDGLLSGRYKVNPKLAKIDC